MEPLTASIIALLAFKKFIKAGTDILAKKFSEADLAKTDELRQKISLKLQEKPIAEAAIKAVEKEGSKRELEKVTAYLDVEILEDQQFEAEVRNLAQEILEGKLQESSQLIQFSNYDNAVGYQTKVEEGNAYIGKDLNIFFFAGHGSLKSESLPRPNNIPRSGTIEFVGREQKLEQLHEQLQQSSCVAIVGMGGVGKTELVLQYAHSHLHKDTYPGGICWIEAQGTDIGSQIISFARSQLGLEPPDDLNLREQVAYCWQHWQQGNVLVVFDDVTDYGKLKAFLPPLISQFKVLVTTRLQRETSVGQISLDALTEVEALTLLQTLISKNRVEGELEYAKALCQWLGYLPLGLEMVGQYLARKPDLSLEEMQQRLETKRLQSQALKSEVNMTTARRGVGVTLELSWQELDEKAQCLGCLLSLFALSPIPWELVEKCVPDWEQEDLKDARDQELVRLSLLNLIKENIYQFHSLVREFFRTKLEQSSQPDDLKQRFCQAMVEFAQQFPSFSTKELIEQFSVAIPHIAEAATTLVAWVNSENMLWLFATLGNFYTQQGVYSQAENWYQLCLSTTRSRFGDEHPDVAASLNNLAYLYEAQGRYNQAEPLYEKALELNQRLLGKEHPFVADSLNNLAHLYEAQGRYNQAEPLFMQALTLNRRLLGDKHPDVAASLNYLAHLFTSQGRYSEAEPLYRQALELNQSLLGADAPVVASSLSNLAGLYYSQGRYSEAEPLYMQALELKRRVLGDEHPDISNIFNNLALLYASEGRYSEAEPMYMQALELKRRVLGDEHPDVATSLNNLALLYASQERYSEAEPLYMQALELKRRVLGDEHPDVATSLNNLAGLYVSQERYSEAEPLYMQALELKRHMLGDEHPDVANTLSNLAKLYTLQKLYSQAELLYMQALEVMNKMLGDEHPVVVTNLNNLARLYTLQERYSEAESLYLKAVEIAIRTLGENHPHTQTVWYNFISFLKKAIDVNQTVTLSNHPLSREMISQLSEGATQ